MVQKKAAPRLKNYRSEASMGTIFEAIRVALASHKAKRIQFDYDDDGQATSIQFMLLIGNASHTFRLPARFENVARLVAESYRSIGKNISGEALREQAYRTAWANLRDWITAQMALIDSGMVKTEEVFLPYLLIEGNMTMFEVFEHQRALPPARRVRIEEVK